MLLNLKGCFVLGTISQADCFEIWIKLLTILISFDFFSPGSNCHSPLTQYLFLLFPTIVFTRVAYVLRPSDLYLHLALMWLKCMPYMCVQKYSFGSNEVLSGFLPLTCQTILFLRFHCCCCCQWHFFSWNFCDDAHKIWHLLCQLCDHRILLSKLFC